MYDSNHLNTQEPGDTPPKSPITLETLAAAGSSPEALELAARQMLGNLAMEFDPRSDCLVTLNIYLHTTLVDNSVFDSYTWQIAMAFATRGHAYLRQDKLVQAINDFSTALRFAGMCRMRTRLGWSPEDSMPDVIEAWRNSCHSLGQYFKGNSSKNIPLEPGYYVVGDGNVLGKYPLEVDGRLAAIQHADSLAVSSFRRGELVQEYAVDSEDFTSYVYGYEYNGARPLQVYKAEPHDEPAE